MCIGARPSASNADSATSSFMLRIVALSICDHLPRSTALSTHNHLPRNAALNSEVSLKRHSVCLGFRISVHERFQGSLKVPGPRRYACKGSAVRTHMPEDPAKRRTRLRLVRPNVRPSAVWVRARGGEGKCCTHMPEDPAKFGICLIAAWRFDRFTAICVHGLLGVHAYPC